LNFNESRILESRTTPDSRGSFTKYLGTLLSQGFVVSDLFSTKSRRGVIRGMHAQSHSCSASKLLFIVSGSIHDVLIPVIDNELGVPEERFMSTSHNRFLYIPKNFFHGFQALDNEVELLYLMDRGYCKNHEVGLNPTSLGINWPVEITEISERDKKLPVEISFAGLFDEG
jgi:dTDP-4-dehydrorhamnose 3,5-epimerase